MADGIKTAIDSALGCPYGKLIKERSGKFGTEERGYHDDGVLTRLDPDLDFEEKLIGTLDAAVSEAGAHIEAGYLEEALGGCALCLGDPLKIDLSGQQCPTALNIIKEVGESLNSNRSFVEGVNS